MGIYITPPTESKLEWLEQVGTEFPVNEVVVADQYLKPSNDRLVFWQPAPWGDNAALGYDKNEIIRLAASRMFQKLFVVPVADLVAINAIGVDA